MIIKQLSPSLIRRKTQVTETTNTMEGLATIEDIENHHRRLESYQEDLNRLRTELQTDLKGIVDITNELQKSADVYKEIRTQLEQTIREANEGPVLRTKLHRDHSNSTQKVIDSTLAQLPNVEKQVSDIHQSSQKLQNRVTSAVKDLENYLAEYTRTSICIKCSHYGARAEPRFCSYKRRIKTP